MSGKHMMGSPQDNDPSGQDAHDPETEEDTASGGPADPPENPSGG